MMLLVVHMGSKTDKSVDFHALSPISLWSSKYNKHIIQ